MHWTEWFCCDIMSILYTLAMLCMSCVPWANEREKQGEELKVAFAD